MELIVEEESQELKKFSEMTVNVHNSLPVEIENSVYYPKLKQLLHLEITRFCKEQYELKEDLNILRSMVGDPIEEVDIRSYLEGLKLKYNNKDSNVGISYHIEATRIDYGVPVFVVIKRNNIHLKKFVFRFRKEGGIGLSGLTNGGLLN